MCDHRCLSLHNFQVTINASTDCFSTADRMKENSAHLLKTKQATLNTDSNTQLYGQLPHPPPQNKNFRSENMDGETLMTEMFDKRHNFGSVT